MPTPQIIHRIDRGSDLPPSYIFEFPQGRGIISGMDQLAQFVIMHLLTTPGSDRYLNEEGGGLRDAFFRLQQNRDFDRAAAEISEAVERTKTQVLLNQAAEEGLSSRERLADLVIEQIEQKGIRIALRLRIISEAEEQFLLEI